MKPTSSQIVQLLVDRKEYILPTVRVQKDEQARRSAMRLDGEHQAARVHDFGLKAGDEATLQNNDGEHVKVTISTMDVKTNYANVTLSSGALKKVQVTPLPCARGLWLSV